MLSLTEAEGLVTGAMGVMPAITLFEAARAFLAHGMMTVSGTVASVVYGLVLPGSAG